MSPGGLTSLAALEGTWTMTRSITHGDGTRDTLNGITTFIRSGPRLLMEETGMLELASGAAPLKAFRRYIWTAEGATVHVMFDDMRPFHSIALGVCEPEAIYLCPPDRYQVTYDFAHWPNWVSRWTVEGPRKSYTMSTAYQPASSSAQKYAGGV